MKTLELRWTVSRGRETYGYNICTLFADGRKRAACNGGGYDMEGTSLGNYIASEFRDRLLELKHEEMPENSHWQSERKRVCDGACVKDFHAKLIDAVANGGSGDGLEMMKLPEDCWECPTCNGPTRSSQDGKRISDGRYFYGLTFHDPHYDPRKAIIGKDCNDRTLGDGAEGKTVEQAEKDGESFGLERYQAFYSASSKFPTERHTIPQIDGACGKSSVERIMKAIGLELQYLHTRSKKLTMYRLIDTRNGESRAA